MILKVSLREEGLIMNNMKLKSKNYKAIISVRLMKFLRIKTLNKIIENNKF